MTSVGRFLRRISSTNCRSSGMSCGGTCRSSDRGRCPSGPTSSGRRAPPSPGQPGITGLSQTSAGRTSRGRGPSPRHALRRPLVALAGHGDPAPNSVRRAVGAWGLRVPYQANVRPGTGEAHGESPPGALRRRRHASKRRPAAPAPRRRRRLELPTPPGAVGHERSWRSPGGGALTDVAPSGTAWADRCSPPSASP